MTVQVKIDPTTGLTKCGNSIEKEDGIQCLFSTVWNSGVQGYGFGIPNVLRNAWQLLSYTMKNKNHKYLEAAYNPHAYWSVDNRPKGTKQIVDSGIFTYLYGEKKNAPLKELEEYAELYIDFVNNHFSKYCKTNNTPWFVELDIHGRYPLEDYHRLQKKLLDSCPNRDFIGVWHSEHGLKNLEEVCEKFDYVSVGTSQGDNEGVKKQGFYWIAEHHPEKLCHMLGTDRIQDYFAPYLLNNMVDTCDCTSWCASKRFGLQGINGGEAYRRKWVEPALKWCNDNWFKYFPRSIPKDPEKAKTHDPESGLTFKNLEGQLWAVCKVHCIWSYFNLYGKQRCWDRGSMRKVVEKILEGKGAELDISDITEPLYEFEEGYCCGQKFYFPKGYKDTFENKVKVDRMNLNM